MKNKYLIIILLVIVVVVTILIPKSKHIPEPTTDYVAIIYHSEMCIDAGTEYIYYIYPTEEEKYIYIKNKADITIEGSGEEKRLTINEINKKSDLKKIEKDINKEKTKDSQTNISYTYLSNGTTINCSCFDELSNKLFD